MTVENQEKESAIGKLRELVEGRDRTITDLSHEIQVIQQKLFEAQDTLFDKGNTR